MREVAYRRSRNVSQLSIFYELATTTDSKQVKGIVAISDHRHHATAFIL